MGNVLDTFAEMNQADGPVEPKPLQHKRLLALDPRSPSACIDRTPIIVERTPAGEKPALVSSQEDTPRTSRVSPSDVVLDPRSPTNDFTRTPINPCIATAVARRISPAMMASGGLHQSPSLSHESESGIESADVTPVLKRRKAKGYSLLFGLL
ncbi:cell division cycle-associated protein 3-like [Physella acuta]|uniref:cell division cycle-associated protein 3-like n=1 Tax=Physella acuta TaxID=109671 RepID=UPI0027DCD274|nr:cell division cycle-associated protein 3-like [Physella acuta]